MRARAACLAVLVAAGVASGEPKPKPVDTKAFRDKLIVLQDQSGGSYIVANQRGSDPRVFYGTGKTVYEQIVMAKSWNEDSWSIHVMAPRAPQNRHASLVYKQDKTYSLFCGDTETGLTQVTGDKAKQILDKSAFMTTGLIHRAVVLARDDHGVYYYVDAVRDEYGGKGFRLFVGRKGGMKELPLLDIASDSSGQVFATKGGELKLDYRKTNDPDANDTAIWVRGDKREPLVVLDVLLNSPVIYGELGVYTFTGTVCDTM
jgi:hypothetical protein